MEISDIVDLVHPTVSGVSVITTDTVWTLFDREMDEQLLGENIFITGPDFDTHSGPDSAIWIDSVQTGDEDEILQSPGFHGIVDGTFSFQRIALGSLSEVSTLDTVASGILYRTKAIFTPTNRLAPDTEYHVYISGDEDLTDSTKTGIATRTIYDPLAAGGNTGTTPLSISGSFSGSVAAIYTIEILTTGSVGTSTFRFWTSVNPTPSSPLRTRRSGTLLSEGVVASFPEGTWIAGDTWTVRTKVRDTHEGNLSWIFTTGSGSIETLPDTTSTSVIGGTVPVTPTTTGELSILSTIPEDETSHLTTPVGDYTVSVLFDDSLVPGSITGLISVTAEAVDGDSVTHPASGLLVTTESVSGPTLSIVIASGQLNNNNLVTITLGSGINSMGGLTLDEDYEFWFTTTYSPYYCTLQKIRLDIGAYISSVSDDTINAAIHQGSLGADALTWDKTYISDSYYKYVRTQWTCCKAQETLLLNAAGKSNLKSKKLADLEVTYATGINEPLDRALGCLQKWENSLHAGGRSIRSPMMVVKGELDPDRPTIGRGWGYANGNMMPTANSRVITTTSRRYRNTYYPGRYGKKRYDA